MAVSEDLIAILVCPETKQPVHLAPRSLLDSLNEKVAAATLRNRGGNPVSQPISAGLLREDGKVLYVIDDDIPVMLIEESIEI